MPISKENKKLYPKNWDKIRKDILKRAKNKCEFCGVGNHLFGIRDSDGDFWTVDEFGESCSLGDFPEKNKFFKIILTIAHLDHNPTNNNYDNLKALCQKCHNSYDAKHRAETRKNKKDKKSPQFNLF
jgi:5-methylcytosine-specific restriction endonuclease McrA